VLGLLHARRIVSPHLGAVIEQAGHQRNRRRFAHVVGVRLEGQAQQANGFAAQVAAERRGHLARHGSFSIVVDRQHRFDDAQRNIMVQRGLHQRAGVLRKARAAEARTRIEKLRSNAVVESDAARNFLHVSADFFRQIRDLVDEGDLGGEKCIRRVLDQLGRAPLGVHDRRLVEVQRAIDLAQHLARALVIGADHDAIGMFEVTDRRTLAQKFRIGRDRDIRLRIGFADDALDLVAGADRNGGLGDDHREALQSFRNVARRRMHIGQVGVAVAAARRRSDRDEHRVGLADGTGEIGGEIQPPGFHRSCDQPVQIGLENRYLAAVKRVDLAGVGIDASHAMAEIRETGAGYQPHIARPDHGNPHVLTRFRSKLTTLFSRALLAQFRGIWAQHLYE